MITWRKGRDIVTADRTEQEGPLDEFLAEPVRRKPPIVRLPGHGHLPQPRQGHDAPGPARRGRAQPRLPREGGDRLAGSGLACPHVADPRPVRHRAPGPGPVQDHPRHHPGRLPGPLERPRRCSPGPQARLSGPQPRPRARVLLRLPDDHRPRRCHPGMARWRKRLFIAWPATPPARSSISACPATAR